MYNSMFDPRAGGGWAPQSNQFGINSLITCNICDHRGIYKKHRPRVLRVRRNFSVNTDRWAAAVVAIDQLPRKIAGVTDTKRKKNAMSEDKINEEQRTATQTVAKAPVDDAIGDDGTISETFAR